LGRIVEQVERRQLILARRDGGTSTD